MSNADSTATSSADTSAAPAGTSGASHDLGQLPERVRVHALAKLIGSSSREVLGKLGELGESARSPQSSVPRAVAVQVAEMFEATASPGQESGGQQSESQSDNESASSGAASAGAGVPEQVSRATAENAGQSQGEDATAQSQPGQAAETGTTGSGAHIPVFAAPSPVFLPPDPEPEPPKQEDTRSDDRASEDSTTAAGSPKGGAGKGNSAKGGSKSAGPKSGGPKNGGPKDTASKDSAPKDGDSKAAADKDASGEDAAGGSGAKQQTQQQARGKEDMTTGSDSAEQVGDAGSAEQPEDGDDSARRRRRRGRRGRGRGKGGDETAGENAERSDSQSSGEDKPAKQDNKQADAKAGSGGGSDSTNSKGADAGGQDDSNTADDGESKRRRRRRRRKSNGDNGSDSTGDDPPNTVTHVRENSGGERDSESDGVRSVRGSTRLEAKRQRRRDGREAGRRRAPILSEAEFLARRESVERTMVVADKDDSTQIGVLEDGVLVEHFVTSSGTGSIVGNVYLGKVQNVLPSMEAAFVDIGRGRNAVLYAGEVDWDSAGLEGKARKIEQALSSGDQVLVQVSKDPVGHKGARLTTQVSLPGRFLVYVPAGATTGISRKLPENERRRLKDILKRVVPEDAGVIIRTASEGISEAELERDVQRLREQWEGIKERSEAATAASKQKSKKSGAPTLLYEEPDLLIKVVRDLFTEDFVKMEIQGERAWDTISNYVQRVAPELNERLHRYVGTGQVLADYRIDEQISKALDRKVWLPSGGYLVIDRTEAMTVIDVNTGKFTGSGGNLEETVTRNNLESAEEIVRQLRLRDIGGIIVIDFIDMVLESNRELVLRRLTECLGRDRTRHQVAEVTSLGLVQMTRKRIGTGLLESFSTTCEHCKGRGLHISTEPNRGGNGSQQQGGSRKQRGKGSGSGSGGGQSQSQSQDQASSAPTQHQRESAAHAVAAMANASKAAPGKPATDSAKSEPTGSSQAVRTAQATEPDSAPDREQEHASDAETAAPAVAAASAGGETSGASGTESASAAQANGQGSSRSGGRRARRGVSRPAGPPVE